MDLRKISGLVGLSLLSACTIYAPQGLPTRVDLPATVAAVPVRPARLAFRQLTTHVYDPSDGLDSDEVAMLAVANNPQLRAARDALGVARAQAFAAGLLPDPQLDLVADHPTNYVPGGATNSFGNTLTYDVNALLLRSSRKNAAVAEALRVNNELLWQEWQVVSQAKLLFVRLVAQKDLMQSLRSARDLLMRRYQASQQALRAGNVTADFAGSDLLALQNVLRQINELERTQLQNKASLNALLGLAESTELDLVGGVSPTVIDVAAVRANRLQLLQQRPDLQALQAGYHAQEEKYRGAVLAQFPALNVGLTRARDNTGIDSLGFGISLSLPIFNRNRGNIAIEQATRKKLFDEYQVRLNSAYSEIALALENLPLLQSQLQRTQLGMTTLQALMRHATVAYQSGNLAAPDYVRMQTALLGKQTETINLTEALAEQRIALETLLGPDLPERSKQ
ncbi:MAG: TolC family protein [Sulfuriferula sp.]